MAKRWIVCHTRPRCEKKLQRLCELARVHCFLPLVTSEKRYGTRIRRHTVPLFPGYVFVRCRPSYLPTLEQNQLCANIITVADQALMEKQLHGVRSALEEDQALQVVPFIQEGRSVLISSGPFAGTKAIIARINDQDHIVIRFEMIQQSVAMRVNWSMLKPAP